MYYCKFEGEQLSAHQTHQEALWTLMNVHTQNMSRDAVSESGYWIEDEDHWAAQTPECPKCGKEGGYMDHEMDLVSCADCGLNSLYLSGEGKIKCE